MILEAIVPGQEKNVSDAFSNQSAKFDELDLQNPILQWMRKQTRAQVLDLSKPGESLLELNAGTGLDAVYFAQKGLKVTATDNAPGMLAEIDKKIHAFGLEEKLHTLQCSFNRLEELGKQRYDHIFSNFGGLNCTDDLAGVIKKMDGLLSKGGTATLVIMPKICPWEILLALKGNFRIAFRRWALNGADSHLEGVHFKTWYYSPRYVKRAFGKDYKLVTHKGLASLSPPPYLEDFPGRFPRLYRRLVRWDEKLCAFFPFRNSADHYMISFRKIA